MTPIGSTPWRYIFGSIYDHHEVTSLEDPIDVAPANGARALSLLVARQPPPGHCPVCGRDLADHHGPPCDAVFAVSGRTALAPR